MMKRSILISTFLLISVSFITASLLGCQAAAEEYEKTAAEESIKTIIEESTEIAYDSSTRFSKEYRSSEYYTKLMQVLEQDKDVGLMQRVLDIAKSQNGYQNYSVEDTDIEQAREDGALWTGATFRMSSNDTGNTEFTRWAQEYILESLDPYFDCDWCAIFVSWCLYQAGYHYHDNPAFYYSYCADPRNESTGNLMESFNFDQNQVWYTAIANTKLEAFMDRNTPVHTNISPYDIPYEQGGLIFFSWDGSGDFFDHIGIVINYDEDEHILTYISGNDEGEVCERSMNYDLDEFKDYDDIKNEYRIMAYAAYSGDNPSDDWYYDEWDYNEDNHAEDGSDEDDSNEWYYDEDDSDEWYYDEDDSDEWYYDEDDSDEWYYDEDDSDEWYYDEDDSDENDNNEW